jgi:hypothetical protein
MFPSEANPAAVSRMKTLRARKQFILDGAPRLALGSPPCWVPQKETPMRLPATIATIALVASAGTHAAPITMTSSQESAWESLAVDIQQQDLSAAHLSVQPRATLTGPLEVRIPLEMRIPEGDTLFELPPHETATGPLEVRIPN